MAPFREGQISEFFSLKETICDFYWIGADKFFKIKKIEAFCNLLGQNTRAKWTGRYLCRAEH